MERSIDVAEDWDLIILSAADESQKQCFEKLLALKYNNSSRPILQTFRVIADLPGPPLGSGGSTLQVLKQLHEEYSDKLYDFKILFIPAVYSYVIRRLQCGFSKRLPSLSCTGKLFLPLPIESEVSADFTLLDVKLQQTAYFLPFFKNGGLLLTASDDVETYSSEVLCSVTFNDDDGVTAIAHPSTIAIGETHGVYVLEPTNASRTKIWVSHAKEVLQKPNAELMKSRGAIFEGKAGAQKVYTDSLFWCGKNVVKKLVDFSSTENAFKFETCMFGDFLTAMGSNAEKYHSLAFKDPRPCNPLLELKAQFYETFKDTRLNVLVLEDSEFFHLGTMVEYLDNLRPDSDLFSFFKMKPRVRCVDESSGSKSGVVINSVINPLVQIKGHSIVEFCRINCPVIINDNVILSSCEITDLPDLAEIPPCWLFHTAAVHGGFVTLALGIYDQVKRSQPVSDLPYGSKTLQALLPSDYKAETEEVSLWNIPLFELKHSMSESFNCTWNMINKFLKDQSPSIGQDPSQKRFSLLDICRNKRIEGFVDFRSALMHSVSSG